MKKQKVAIIILSTIILVFAGLYIYDAIAFRNFKSQVDLGYKLSINETLYEASRVEGKQFLFHKYQNSEIINSVSVPQNSVLNLPENYILTDQNDQQIEGEITYLSDGEYTLYVEEDEINYIFKLSVDNDFTVDIDAANSYQSGYLLVSFNDLNDNETINIDTEFVTTDNLFFQTKNMLIPIAYQNEIKEYFITFASEKSSVTENVTVNDYNFRVSRFNVSSSVVSSASEDPDPDVLAAYNNASKTVSDIAYYKESGFTVPAKGTLTGDFGDIRYINGSSSISGYHYGIDYANSLNTEIYSTATGKVIFSDFLPSTGNVILIDHGQGIISQYMHLQSSNVKVGDMVSQSTIIGYMGTTGYSTGVHLHFEILVGDVVVNPYLFLNNSKFKES